MPSEVLGEIMNKRNPAVCHRAKACPVRVEILEDRYLPAGFASSTLLLTPDSVTPIKDLAKPVTGPVLDPVSQGRRFLAKVARYRLLNHLHRQAVERERPLEPTAAEALPASQARPSAEARAAELWDHILACCPPAHRELVRLRRDGVPLAEIASWTGLHEGSVRRILYDLARAVAARDKSRGPRGRRSSGE